MCDSFDLAVHAANGMNSSSEQWDAFVTEMQGQLLFFAGTLLLKRAQKVSAGNCDEKNDWTLNKNEEEEETKRHLIGQIWSV